MNITNVKINPIQNEVRLKAVVSVTFDDALVVHDIKVIHGPERVFLAMPSRKMADGTYRDIVHPISADMRRTLENVILEQYKMEMASGQTDSDIL